MTGDRAAHLSLAVSPGGSVPDRCTSRVLESASFLSGWTISESSGILRALDALHCGQVPSPVLTDRILLATARAVAYLTAVQNADGGWGQHATYPSDVLSTAQAVPALVRHGSPAACR